MAFKNGTRKKRLKSINAKRKKQTYCDLLDVNNFFIDWSIGTTRYSFKTMKYWFMQFDYNILIGLR